MTFIWPWMLFSLVIVPLSGLSYWLAQRRRKRYAASLGALGRVQDNAPRPLNRRRHLPAILYLTGLALLALAMARPEMVVALPRIEGTVILAFDVSASMGAEDMEPNRIEAAKVAARAFIEGQPQNIQIGVVAFSDGGLVAHMPTDDREALIETINRFVPQNGTSLGQGILVALNTALADPDPADPGPADSGPADSGPAANNSAEGGALPQTPLPSVRAPGAFAPVVIVLLSDGENMDAFDPLEAAQIAIEQGVRIYTVGIGSPEGTVLEIDGFNVFTQLNEDMLKQIAETTEGKYYYAADSGSLEEIYKNLDLQFAVKPEKMEITSLLAGLSFLVLLAGGGFALVWFGRLP